ncbi:MAG: hypothetical protein CMC07_00175 [Flavobacteriaceae bacterium]|nr:hypothetical protein [Flavobacteriaceae bacterium]
MKHLNILICFLFPLFAFSQGGPIKTESFKGTFQSEDTSYYYTYDLTYQLQSSGTAKDPLPLS